MKHTSYKIKFTIRYWLLLSLILLLCYEVFWYPIKRHQDILDALSDWSTYCADLITCMILAGIDLMILRQYFKRYLLLKWTKYNILSVIVGLLLFNILLSFGIALIHGTIYEIIDHKWDLADKIIDTYEFSLVSSFLIMISMLIYYIDKLQEMKVSREREKRAALEAKILSLQSQINPHFLFNNLSAAIGLVELDSQKAVTFLSQLAAIYRHTLVRNEQILVSISDELANLHNYLSLMSVRHGECIALLLDESVSDSNAQIFPGTLQLLMENIFKHNKLSNEDPIKVSIKIEDDSLIIQNDYRPIASMTESLHIGNNNIRKRYEAIGFGNKVIFAHTETTYTITLPVIKNTLSHEYTDY